MVYRSISRRSIGSLWCVHRRPALAFTGTADPICRLQRLAAGVSRLRGAGAAAGLLEAAAGGNQLVEVTHRPAAAGNAEPKRLRLQLCNSCESHAKTEAVGGTARRHLVYGPAGSISDLALPL